MIIFDSRNTKYKNPYGAVKENCSIHFKIILPRSLNCRYSTLKIHIDETSKIENIGMFWCGMYDDLHEMWECDYTPCNIGVYWYNFEIQTDSISLIIGKHNKCSKAVIGSSDKWQLTCYKKDFTTPKWLHGGIMYQIFPDRFFYSGIKKQNVPQDRTIHTNWNDTPNYTPNKEGKYLNNDFFCGDIQGIIQKIPYLKDLGVTCIYLNPIFESHSNHRYDTANYQNIDPLLGTIDDFKQLCVELKKSNIHLILDGVFSHTGDDSVYFNKRSRYKTVGAYNSKNSPFYKWYNFDKWPDSYKSWWGINTLPETNENFQTFNDFINGEKGIIRKWLNLGASGWRLDVADELPDGFLYNLRNAAKTENKNSIIIGEVWEDASNKISYGKRRKFLLGKQLDSVMNYPFKNAILDFVTGRDGREVAEEIESILENYPAPAIKVMMNPLSTHDTIRAITRIAGKSYNGQNRSWQANNVLSKQEYEHGIILMKLASTIQFTLPGIPCIYYGDEAGVQGYLDPFNRTPFPWNNKNIELINWYKNLSLIRHKCKYILSGTFKILYAEKSIISYMWQNKNEKLQCLFNSSNNDISLKLNNTDIKFNKF